MSLKIVQSIGMAMLLAGSLGAQEGAATSKTKVSAATAAEMSVFLAARKADIRAARQEPHRSFLAKLILKGSKSEQVWALTRLTEAGDYRNYAELLNRLVAHVQGASQFASGHGDDVLQESLPLGGAVYRLHASSPWWLALETLIWEDPERTVDGAVYALWCYNTRPSQRALILDIAAHIQPKARNGMDPWADPRFWIVTDWAIAWGGPEDFEALQRIIPEGPARQVFMRQTKLLRETPGFFSCSLPPPDLEGAIDAGSDGTDREVLQRPRTPAYPSAARSRGLMTRLQVRTKVDEEGKPCGYRPLPGPWLAFFAPTGVAYLKDWRFEPALPGGKPVADTFRLVMPFRLTN